MRGTPRRQGFPPQDAPGVGAGARSVGAPGAPSPGRLGAGRRERPSRGRRGRGRGQLGGVGVETGPLPRARVGRRRRRGGRDSAGWRSPRPPGGGGGAVLLRDFGGNRPWPGAGGRCVRGLFTSEGGRSGVCSLAGGLGILPGACVRGVPRGACVRCTVCARVCLCVLVCACPRARSLGPVHQRCVPRRGRALGWPPE